MVNNNSALGRTGVYDFITLRITAIVIMLYFIYITVFLFMNNSNVLTWETWTDFFKITFTKIFTLLSLLCMSIHAWIGIWQILTDYVKSMAIRLSLQAITIALLTSYVIYGFIIMWRV